LFLVLCDVRTNIYTLLGSVLPFESTDISAGRCYLPQHTRWPAQSSHREVFRVLATITHVFPWRIDQYLRKHDVAIRADIKLVMSRDWRPISHECIQKAHKLYIKTMMFGLFVVCPVNATFKNVWNRSLVHYRTPLRMQRSYAVIEHFHYLWNIHFLSAYIRDATCHKGLGETTTRLCILPSGSYISVNNDSFRS